MKTIIANFKCNISSSQIASWAKDFNSSISFATINSIKNKNLNLIVAPQSLSLQQAKISLAGLAELCIQDVCSKQNGPYTGQINADSAAEFVKYALIGHHETRVSQNQTQDDILGKLQMCQKANITPILCLDNKVQYAGCTHLAYEPLASIGTKNAATLEQVLSFKDELKLLGFNGSYFYGGSVDQKNLQDFMQCSGIDGVLVGSASLDAKHFADMINSLYSNAT